MIIIIRQKTYSRPLGYNCRGILATPMLSSEETLNNAIQEHDYAKKHWDKHKSASSLVRNFKTSLNFKIAKRELDRREKGKELVDRFKEEVFSEGESNIPSNVEKND